MRDFPPETEWFANIQNANTRSAYEGDVKAFFAFLGVKSSENFREVRRGHVIAWRDKLHSEGLGASSIRRKLAALSSLYAYLCDQNAVVGNPIDGVGRPPEGTNEEKTPALSDAQARALLEAPDPSKLKGIRDRTILAVFLYSGIRIGELCSLRVRDIEERRGSKFFHVRGKRSKIRYVLVHTIAHDGRQGTCP